MGHGTWDMGNGTRATGHVHIGTRDMDSGHGHWTWTHGHMYRWTHGHMDTCTDVHIGHGILDMTCTCIQVAVKPLQQSTFTFLLLISKVVPVFSQNPVYFFYWSSRLCLKFCGILHTQFYSILGVRNYSEKIMISAELEKYSFEDTLLLASTGPVTRRVPPAHVCQELKRRKFMKRNFDRNNNRVNAVEGF